MRGDIRNCLPKQRQPKPGEEATLDPAPMYDALHYLGSQKLKDKVAIITGEVLPIVGGYSGG